MIFLEVVLLPSDLVFLAIRGPVPSGSRFPFAACRRRVTKPIAIHWCTDLPLRMGPALEYFDR